MILQKTCESTTEGVTTMTVDPNSIDLPAFMAEHLQHAEPDLLRSMLSTLPVSRFLAMRMRVGVGARSSTAPTRCTGSLGTTGRPNGSFDRLVEGLIVLPGERRLDRSSNP